MALGVEHRTGGEKAAAADAGLSREARPATAYVRAWRAIRLVAGVAAVLVILVLGGFLAFVGSLDRLERWPPTSTDGIVALTGGAQRIGDAIELLAQGFARRLLITGVNERTSREEIARLNPEKRALVECCVDLDYRAQNTIGNAEETRRWATRNGFRSIIVVTSNYHMPRTLAELDHAVPEVRKVPFAVVTTTESPTWWHSFGTTRLLFSEYAKYVAVLARTRLSTTNLADDAPAPGRQRGYNSARLVAEPAASR